MGFSGSAMSLLLCEAPNDAILWTGSATTNCLELCDTKIIAERKE